MWRRVVNAIVTPYSVGFVTYDTYILGSERKKKRAKQSQLRELGAKTS